MKYIAKAQTQKFTNSASCVVFEYPFGDKDINGAVSIVNGRYPEQGRVTNEVCKELMYVISGTGVLYIGKTVQKLEVGGLVFIEPGDEYYLEGKDLEVFMPCSPAWYPGQHKQII